jgi:hypothetical protein
MDYTPVKQDTKLASTEICLSFLFPLPSCQFYDSLSLSSPTLPGLQQFLLLLNAGNKAEQRFIFSSLD